MFVISVEKADAEEMAGILDDAGVKILLTLWRPENLDDYFSEDLERIAPADRQAAREAIDGFRFKFGLVDGAPNPMAEAFLVLRDKRIRSPQSSALPRRANATGIVQFAINQSDAEHAKNALKTAPDIPHHLENKEYTPGGNGYAGVFTIKLARRKRQPIM